jgi:hypothetical protein
MKKTSSFLTGFLAMLVAAGLLSSAGTAQAALISINIGSFGIGGINGGVAIGSSGTTASGSGQAIGFPISGNTLNLYNNYIGLITGLQGNDSNGPELMFASEGPASPQKFSLGDSIYDGSAYSNDARDTTFRYNRSVSQDFGPGSYMGFLTAQGNYGWLEVTWDSASDQFEILSGAYESDPDVAILAGAGPGPAAVPEPGTWAAAALLASGAAFMRWRKRAKVS